MSTLLLSVLLACAPESAEHATAYQLNDLGDGIGGPKALARKGDYIIENDKMRFGILGARNSFGPGLYGGSLIDADVVREGLEYRNGHGNDRFVELNPTVNLDISFLTEETQIEILDTDDGSAVIRVTALGKPYLGILVPLRGITPGNEPAVAIVTDYILRPGEPWLTLRTTATVVPKSGGMEGLTIGEFLPGLQDPESVVEIALGGGVAMGDFYQQGGAVDAFLSDVGFDEAGAIFAADQEDRNLFWSPFSAEVLGGTADGVSYGMASKKGNLLMPLFASSQTVAIGAMSPAPMDESTGEADDIPLGTAFTYERIFTVGHGDMGSVVDNVLLAKDIESGFVGGHVLEAGSGAPVSGAKVFVYRPGADAPWSQWTTDVAWDDTNGDGSFAGTLPIGDWELQAHEHGRPVSERFTIVVGDEDVEVNLDIGHTGTVAFVVRDESGDTVPAKLTVMRTDQEALRNPILGDGFIGGRPESVLFAPFGHAETHLAPGDYTATATRGPEYEIDTLAFSVGANTHLDLDLAVLHSVDTTGWIGADLHVHGNPSFDSGVNPVDRVMTMVSEGVEFMASTDHDFIFDYAPTIQNMNLGHWIRSSVGVEVTPLEMGHFIAFGIEHDFLADAGGAFDWKGRTPGEILASLEASGAGNIDPVTMVAHPRDGILGYFDQFGFNPHGGIPGLAGQPGTADLSIPLNSQVTDFQIFTEPNFTLKFDALELFNGKRLDLIRTPTAKEISDFAEDNDSVNALDILTRDLTEMAHLEDGTFGLGYGHKGQIDDWFSLLNLGFRHTALANSDTHSMTSVESGCPRNFVQTGTDDPDYVTEAEVASAIREHRVIASYGPFVRFWIDDEGIGSELVGTGERTLRIESQAPSWMGVGHLELYENGTLIDTWDRPETEQSNIIWEIESTVNPGKDSWYVVIASGEGSLFPLFSPVEIPSIELQDIVVEAVGAVIDDTSLLGELIPVPKTHPIYPYALTNPIWIDLGGNGFDAPGIPAWQEAPINPSDAEE
jgi:hypothetical protein